MNRRAFLVGTATLAGTAMLSSIANAARPKYVVGRGKFKTINSAYSAAAAGSVVEVLPGTYTETIVLRDGVELRFDDGAVLTWDAADGMPLISDPPTPTNGLITGLGTFIRSGSDSVWAVKLSGGGSHSLTFKSLTSSSVGVFQNAGTLVVNGDIDAVLSAIKPYPGAVSTVATGNWHSSSDYCIWADAGDMHFTGTARSDGNSAVTASGNGTCTFSGTATSSALYGVEVSGGECVLRDATISSTHDAYLEGDAISFYSGYELTLDNVTLSCVRADAYSVGTQDNLETVTVQRDCHANRPVAPTASIVGGQIIVA